MNRAFDFATIGFRPYTETGEFVTFGLIALDVKARKFDFTLLDRRRVGRVKHMFPNLPENLYGDAWEMLRIELEAVKDAVNEGTFGANPAFPLAQDHQGLFNALTTPRDGVFSCPVKGRRLARDMAGVLADLKARYIDQNILHPPQSVEAGMTSEIIKVLRRAGLADVFDRDVKVGPVSYKVNFPLAQMRGHDRADRVIKPLNFAGKTPTEIYNHGDEWLRKLQRLKTLGFRPEHSLFAVREPVWELELRAFQEIRNEFLEEHIVLADEADEAKVVEFAKSGQLRGCLKNS